MTSWDSNPVFDKETNCNIALSICKEATVNSSLVSAMNPLMCLQH